ncbi:helix-turn-helix domain-containing protein [Thermaurantiacus sp.]
MPDNVHPFPTPEPTTLGADLRRARERAGLTLADLAHRIKVRPGILSSLEADAHDRLPAMTYALGFVKAYARTVGLDPNEAAERFRRESRREEPAPSILAVEPIAPRRLPGRRLVVATTAGVLSVIGVLLALGLFERPFPEPPAGPSLARPPAAAPTLSTAAPAPGNAFGSSAANTDGAVKLVARDDVWIRVQEGPRGERLFEGTLVKGQALDIPPGRPWLLRAGRAGALQVLIGDEMLPPLGGDGDVLAAQSLLPSDLRARAAPRGGLAEGPPAP